MKLSRPSYVPLSVRLQVVHRMWQKQKGERLSQVYGESSGAYLKRVLSLLIDGPPHLDHEPPLACRQKIKRKGLIRYRPDANDPDYLVYRSKQSHREKTFIRGDGAQYPDRVRIAKIRRIERPRKKKKYRWAARGFGK
jgi:hypothetical protein